MPIGTASYRPFRSWQRCTSGRPATRRSNWLGGGGDLWSGVMTQYCDCVAFGAQSCPASNNAHVAYPTGGALAGVWVDESTASPNQATAFQLGTEAVNAAAHFGNTTAAANRDAQYVIMSPTGTHPDGFNTPSGGCCAWHDWNCDAYVGVSSPYGDIAFTNSPYVTVWRAHPDI